MKNYLSTIITFEILTAVPVFFVLCLFSMQTEAASYFNGKTIFSKHCAQCHGDDGKGKLAGTPNFSRGQRLMRSDLELLKTIETGKNAMPAFQGVLKRQEMLDAIAYIRTFY